MEMQPPSYRREFFKSPHHALLALGTLGLGFLSAQLLGLIIGAVAYVLGWIYLPDLPLFRKWADRRQANANTAAEEEKVAAFVLRRDSLLRSLSLQRREKYALLVKVCRDIEVASTDALSSPVESAADTRLRKLDELMWTYLRLLGIEESLERFLETERDENVPTMVKDAEAEVTRLNAEIEGLRRDGDGQGLETRQRYLGSRLERLEVLRKRLQRSDQAKSNLALVVSEQERLDQQIKLIRADAIATRNAETLTARIDATVEHLDQTNKWLAELDEFKDLVGDMPATDLRVGYQPQPVPPPLPANEGPQIRRQPPLRQRQA